MKIIQKYKLFEHKSSYEASENGSGSINYSMNIQVFVAKSMDAKDWDPAIEVTLTEDGKGRPEPLNHTQLLDSLSLSDINTADYAISHFTPEGHDNYESAPIHFYLADNLILELETRDRSARIFTNGTRRNLSYSFQSPDELQGFIDILREAINQIASFMKSAEEEQN